MCAVLCCEHPLPVGTRAGDLHLALPTIHVPTSEATVKTLKANNSLDEQLYEHALVLAELDSEFYRQVSVCLRPVWSALGLVPCVVHSTAS